MRLFLISLLLILSIFTLAYPLDLKLESFTVGSFWDMQNDEIMLGGDLTLFEFKKLIYGSIGLATTGQNGAITTGGITINLPTLIKKLGGNWLSEDNVRFGLWIGKDFNAHRNYWGLFGNISIKI